MCYNERMSTQKDKKPLKIIGNNVLVSVAGIDKIPAKVDTGADSSTIWASQIRIKDDNKLEFTLLGKSHPLYTGEKLSTASYSVQRVRSSNGQVSIRYRVVLPMRVKGKTIRTKFTLSNRSRNRFPILIGRKTLQNKFLVDVSKVAISRPATFDNTDLNAELKANPQEFYRKYMSYSRSK